MDRYTNIHMETKSKYFNFVSVCVFVCLSTVISSIFGKSSHFPFPYFVLFVLRYFPFHVVSLCIFSLNSCLCLFQSSSKLRNKLYKICGTINSYYVIGIIYIKISVLMAAISSYPCVEKKYAESITTYNNNHKIVIN